MRKSFFALILLCLFVLVTNAVAQETYLAKPADINLEGSVRKESIVSPLGPVELRWPRKVEVLFGRTPQRAVADAMLTASRALKQAGFPLEMRTLKNNWQIVFMDENVPETQVPSFLVSNCHPAWMTPPGNIYVVAQRVVAGCSNAGQKVSSQVADAKLVQILLHEIGHGLEVNMMRGTPRDQMLAEGFASWFEQYSADYSSIIRRGELKNQYRQWAKISYRMSPDRFEFTGSALDYARASQYFWLIVDVKGVAALMQVYNEMRDKKVDFFTAAEKRIYWKRAKFEQDIANILKK